MRIYTEIKPIVFGFPLSSSRVKKLDIETRVNNYLWSLKTRAKNWNLVYGVNYEKRRAKRKQTKYKNGKTKKTEILFPSYWIAWLYIFPEGTKIKIKQNARNFKIVKS